MQTGLAWFKLIVGALAVTTTVCACGGSSTAGEDAANSTIPSSSVDTRGADIEVCEALDLHGTLLINNLDEGVRLDQVLERALIDLEDALQSRGGVSEDMDDAAQELYEDLVRSDRSPANVDATLAGDLRVGVRLVADVCTELGFTFDGD